MMSTLKFNNNIKLYYIELFLMYEGKTTFKKSSLNRVKYLFLTSILYTLAEMWISADLQRNFFPS